MYMPGRLRTGSRPSRTWISSPVYLVCAISVHPLPARRIRQRLDRDGLGHEHEADALHDLMALAAARRDFLRVRVDGDLLAALVGLDLERVALHAGDEADDRVVVRCLDHGDTTAGSLELRDLVRLAMQDVTIARGDRDGVGVVARDHAQHL